MEGVLKSSCMPTDVASLKTHPPHHHQQPALLCDDLWSLNNNGQNLETDFFVDDLLDFSNAPVEDPEEHSKPHDNKFDKIESPTALSTATKISPKHEFGPLPDSGLDVPADDLESLEWLSHFVEDSFSGYSLTCPVSKLQPAPIKARCEQAAPVETKPSFATPVQTKARTKRARTGGRVWSLGSPPLTESSSSSTSSSSTTTTSSSSPLPCSQWLVAHSAESLLGKQQAKRQKSKPAILDSAGGGAVVVQQTRRCSHCGVQKTPQWRAGPLGSKTLCNACGVRFKSGRLLPEYRPACSPTFSSELHSNNHRKVMEMRRKKDVETGLTTPPVQSF